MNQLEQRLRHIALEKELTPTIQEHIVSCGESMSQIILSAYLNEVVSKARQVGLHQAAVWLNTFVFWPLFLSRF